MDFIYKVQRRNAFYTIFNIEVDRKHNEKEATRRYY